MKAVASGLLAFGALIVANTGLSGQTLEATKAVHEVKCGSYLGIFNKCVTVETDRIHSTFTRAKIGYYMFGRTWATASHCTRLDATQTKCQQSVFISTDPAWNRILWGQSANNFLRLYGTGGTPAEGAGHFLRPLGVDMSRREGEWHVGFIADAGNNRVAVIAVGYTCRCVRWLGTLDGSESGTPLSNPHDVAWDHADTWTLADDRVFIADTDNNRVVVYQVNLNPVGGTMTKTYEASFGSQGSGPAQFTRPRGITARSFSETFQVPWGTVTIVSTDVYVSDTDNRRVAFWSYGSGSANAVAQTASIAGSEFVGITRDYYGDVIVADRARDVLVKYAGYTSAPFLQLKTYGGTGSWATGNFNDPTDADVIEHYWQDGSGRLIREGLPFVSTVERWTSTTGGQLHHLGVDAEELAVTAGQCDATFTFLFTATGDYNIRVKNAGGGVVASWSRVGVKAGRKSEYWNAQGHTAGTYSYDVEHRNAYGDVTTWRTSNGPSFALNCFTVLADVPSSIGEGGTYNVYGWASHAANGWQWIKAYSFWSNDQNTSFYVPHDPGTYTIDWELQATRASDGAGDTDFRSTYVSIPPPPGDCDLPPPQVCEPQSPPNRIVASSAVAQVSSRGLARRNHHLGSGAWIGARTSGGPSVTQFFAFGGRPGSTAMKWANALAGDRDTAAVGTATRQRLLGRAAFSTRPLGEGQEAYRIRVGGVDTRLASVFVGLALDPELGTRPGDDLLGVDQESGLIWIADPDSGALGYLLPELPPGARVTVRQFSLRKDAWRPDPVSDSAAYTELSAGEPAITGKRGDVRLLIAIGPVEGFQRSIDVGMILLRAASLADLRELAARAPRSILALFTDDPSSDGPRTGITSFRVTQAPPDPAAQPGVAAIAPALVPGLLVAQATPANAADQSALREAVRRHGITALAFAVPDGAPVRVKIRIYDPTGRLLRTLIDDSYASGAYRVQWDVTDQRGRRAAPGVYLAIMEATGFRGMTRLVVVP